MVLQLVETLGAVLGQLDGIALGGQQHFEAFADIDLVVDDEDFASAGRGRRVAERSFHAAFTGFLAGAGDGEGKFQTEAWRRRCAGWRLRSSHHALE